MTRLEALTAALAEGPGACLGDVRIVRDREVHGAVRPEALPALVSLLGTRFEAELLFMVAVDERPRGRGFAVHYLFGAARDDWFVHATLRTGAEHPVIPSLATACYPASRFEREIADLFGIRAEGHPDPRPLVRHGFWPADWFPLRRDAAPREFVDDGQAFPFTEVGGEGVYEIPVGPVHAGIIEPGHFRFSVVGETIIDMKARLYFTHKGTEKLFEERDPAAAVELAERISGDTTVGHALAFCQALEAATGTRVPDRARYLRVMFLELERLYNHVADFGMIANDTGYAVAQAHCARIREQLLRLNKQLTGSRLLRGAIVPGGVGADLTGACDLPNRLDAALRDFEEIVDLTLENTLVRDRLDGTGRLTTRTARDHGVLGYVARASGIDRDVRRDHPFAAYGALSVRVPVFDAGDVKARTLVRVAEARESVRLIRQAAAEAPSGLLAVPLEALPPFSPAFSLVEGWRGAIVHWVMGGERGRLYRVKVMDPSFLNWRALSYALLENIVPDFPLCNKSFNQSYSGHDL